jgi:2-polyprenyl-6-methoxyphenol hydroxylase-like FAD-dependent oxidoreductase
VRVLIAGAGIGGLTAALSLHAAGVEVSVIESASALRPLGAGIKLLPHAVRELTELGLGDELAASGIALAETVHFDQFGNPIWKFATGRNAGYRWPQYSAQHGEVQMILLDAVRCRLGPDVVRTGTTFVSFEESTAGVSVKVRRGTAGDHASMHADVLVGADGLYSGVRAQLHHSEPPPRRSGIRSWRGVTPGQPFRDGRTTAVLGTNAALKFVAFPISRKAELQGSALIHWAAEVMMPGDHDPVESADWDRTGQVTDVLPWFAGWTTEWLDVPALITGAEQIFERPMVDRDPLPSWGSGRVTLLGDAAHPMYPTGSNSTSQAVVDARVLAYSLATATSPEDGLAAYEACRREKANAIVLACRDMPTDRMLRMVSVRAPEGFDRITDVLSAAELAAFEDAYRKTTLPEVAALNERASYAPPASGAPVS